MGACRLCNAGSKPFRFTFIRLYAVCSALSLSYGLPFFLFVDLPRNLHIFLIFFHSNSIDKCYNIMKDDEI